MLSLEVPVSAEAEDPILPAVDSGRGLRRGLVIDGQTGRDGRLRGVAGQPDLQGVDQAAAGLVVGVGLVGKIADGVVEALELVLAEKAQQVFPSAASRRLGRDENMDLGFFAVTDVIDESDLGFDVVEITGSAIDKDARGGLF